MGSTDIAENGFVDDLLPTSPINGNPGWDETKNEWRIRICDPAKFDRLRRKAIGKGVSITWGIKDGKPVPQGLQFKKARYSLNEAKAWKHEHPTISIYQISPNRLVGQAIGYDEEGRKVYEHFGRYWRLKR